MSGGGHIGRPEGERLYRTHRTWKTKLQFTTWRPNGVFNCISTLSITLPCHRARYMPAHGGRLLPDAASHAQEWNSIIIRWNSPRKNYSTHLCATLDKENYLKSLQPREKRSRGKMELKEMCRGISQVVQVCPVVTNRKCTKCDARLRS